MKVSKKDLKNIQAEIERNFPQLKVEKVQILDEGIDSRAYLVNNDLVFRFPKHKIVISQLQMEIRLLPELRKYINLEIPNFEYIGKQKNGFPFVGYKYIDGQFLEKNVFSRLPAKVQSAVLRQIVTFIRQVHSFPLKRAKQLKVREVNYEKRFADTLKWYQKNGKKILGQKTLDFALKTFQEYKTFAKDFQYKPTLLYADIHPWHVLFDKKKKRINGIIDFGDVEIGDPDYEFLRLYDNYGATFVNKLLQIMKYPDQKQVMRKIRWLSEVNRLEDVVTGIERDDKVWSAWAIPRLKAAIKKNKL